MKTWYRFSAKAADPSVVEIHIIDFIGGWIDDAINRMWNEEIGVTARAFVEQLSKLGDEVKSLVVHINSPGGDVWGGVNIANALREQQLSKGRKVETVVDGLAASIASVIAMAGSKVTMADNALFMVHNPWSIALGEAADMRKAAEMLDTVREQIVATYKWHADLEDDEIRALMDAETWMTAAEAKDKGFVTDVIEGLSAAASISPAAVVGMKIPEQHRARVDALIARPEPTPDPEPEPQPADAVEVLQLCEDAGCADMAKALISSKATIEAIRAEVEKAKAAREREAARAAEVRSVCKLAGHEDLADGLVASGMPIAAVRDHVQKVKAKVDRVEIDSNLKPDDDTRHQAQLNPSEIYARRNNLRLLSKE
jgi:ATP-dependent protease ClpP protease subunit